MSNPELARAWARLGVRRARAAVRRARPLPRTPPLGPALVDGHTLLLRGPRPSDAAAWTARRIADQQHLEASSSGGRAWAQAHTTLAWLERWTALRTARLSGAQPHVVILDGELVGECGFDAVDLGTGTAELSVWMGRHHAGPDVVRVAVALACLAVLTAPGSAVERLVAPSAVDNPRAGAVAADVGFTREATLTALRETGAGRVDHHLWVLHRSPEAVAGLRAALARWTTPPPA